MIYKRVPSFTNILLFSNGFIHSVIIYTHINMRMQVKRIFNIFTYLFVHARC